jgi:hypothetical protein
LLEDPDLDLGSLQATLTLIKEGRLVAVEAGWEALLDSLSPPSPHPHPPMASSTPAHHLHDGHSLGANLGPSGGSAGPMEVDHAAKLPSCYSLHLVPSVSPDASKSSSHLDEFYGKHMSPLVLGEFDSSQPRAYNRAFRQMAGEMASGESSSQVSLPPVMSLILRLPPLSCHVV